MITLERVEDEREGEGEGEEEGEGEGEEEGEGESEEEGKGAKGDVRGWRRGFWRK